MDAATQRSDLALDAQRGSHSLQRLVSTPRPKALDLYCCAGGAAVGLHRAGYDVTGWDIVNQPRYPFEFVMGNALDADLTGYDFVWASPPCQAHSNLKSLHAKQHECFIVRTREKLKASGLPYIIENVMGAPLENPVMLCGSAFGLNVRRHRIFESNIFLTGTDCEHWKQPEPLSVTGHFDGYGAGSRKARKPRNLKEAQEAMGMDWTSAKEIVQAIPPAFSEYLARQVLRVTASANVPVSDGLKEAIPPVFTQFIGYELAQREWPNAELSDNRPL